MDIAPGKGGVLTFKSWRLLSYPSGLLRAPQRNLSWHHQVSRW